MEPGRASWLGVASGQELGHFERSFSGVSPKPGGQGCGHTAAKRRALRFLPPPPTALTPTLRAPRPFGLIEGHRHRGAPGSQRFPEPTARLPARPESPGAAAADVAK